MTLNYIQEAQMSLQYVHYVMAITLQAIEDVQYIIDHTEMPHKSDIGDMMKIQMM